MKSPVVFVLNITCCSHLTSVYQRIRGSASLRYIHLRLTLTLTTIDMSWWQ